MSTARDRILERIRIALDDARQVIRQDAPLAEIVAMLRRNGQQFRSGVDDLAALLEEEKGRGDPPDVEDDRLATLAHAADHPGTLALGDLVECAGLAVLRGDWELAARALDGAVDSEWIAPIMTSRRALAAAIEKTSGSIGLFEDAVRALSRWPDARRLRGALLILLGRRYRDEVGSIHLAAAAFVEAGHVLDQRDPEPAVELGDLLRRLGRGGEAHDRLDGLPASHPARIGALLGLARLAEDEARWAAVYENCHQAALRIEGYRDPVATIERLAPVPCGTAYHALAEVVERTRPEVAMVALDRALTLPIRGAARFADADAWLLRGMLRSAQGHPGAAEDLCAAGRRLTWRGAYSEAIPVLRESLRRQPSQLAAMQLADALRMREQTMTATGEPSDGALLEEADGISRDALTWGQVPRNLAWALSSRGLLLERRAIVGADADLRWQAATCAERAIMLAPTEGYHRAALARFHRELGLEWSAFDLTRRGRELAPSDPFVVEERVTSLANAAHAADALGLLPLLNDNPWRRGIEGYLRVRAATTREELEAADKLMDQTIAGGQREAWVRLVWSSCLRRLGRLTDARAQCELALEQVRGEPGSPAIFEAEARLWCEDYRGAIERAEAGLADGRDTQELLLVLGLAHACLGDVDAALARFERLLVNAWGPLAEFYRRVLVEEAPALPPFGRAGRADVQALRASISERLDGLVGRENPVTPMTEVDAWLQATRISGSRRTALLLAKIRLLRGAFTAEARAEADRLLDEVAATEPEVAEAGRIRLDELATDAIVLAMQDGDLLGARALVDAHWAIVEHDPERRGPWRVRRAAALACAPATSVTELAAFCAEAAAEGVVPDDIERWLIGGAQAARLGEAVDGIFPALTVAIDAWLPRHLGMTSGAPAAPSPITLQVPVMPRERLDTMQRALAVAQAAHSAAWGIELPQCAVRFLTRSEDVGIMVRGLKVASFRWDPAELDGDFASRIFAAVLPHLGDLVGLQEVAVKVDRAGGVGTHLLIQRLPHLARLTRLCRALLRERIPVLDWRALTSAANRHRHLPLQDQVAHARRRLFTGLAIESRPAATIAVPPSLETRIAVRLDVSRADRCFAAPPAEVQAMLDDLRPLMTGPGKLALVVERESIRPWLAQIVALEWPDVMVVTSEECKRASWPAPRASNQAVELKDAVA